jgi:methyltransferase
MSWTPDRTRMLYLGLIGLVVVQRLAELALSTRHERRLRRRGGTEAGASHYPWMVAMHAAFLASAPLEVYALDRPFVPPLALSMLALLGCATALRAWAILTLGERWTTRVICLPGAELVASGPYRWMRHPNYLAVAVEIVALPLVHAAWCTALVFGAANAFLLRSRIAVENAALGRCSRPGGSRTR